MDHLDVVAVVGACAPERARYARRLAQATGRPLLEASPSPDPVDAAAELARWGDRPRGAVMELPHLTPITDVIGAFADPASQVRLSEVVCVADAAHLLDDLAGDARRIPPWRRSTARERGMHPMLMAAQMEYASLIVLVNWSVLSTADLSTLMALVSHLSPHARLHLERDVPAQVTPGDPYAAGQERPGWVGVLNDDFEPHMTDHRVSAFRYENVRPLHPSRLSGLLEQRIGPGEFGTVIRSAGFCRLATRPHITARWDHVGQMISFDPLGRDDILDEDEEMLAIGQDLAFIGLDLDHGTLAAALDAAVLTDDEIAAGPTRWAELPDPFPAWPLAEDRSE